MKLGIVGLPNVGKSTLFNAITNAGAQAANYPFCTIEPNAGIVSVPDDRLQVLANMYHPKKVTPATVEFVDIAGLVKGASHGEGLGNKFLSHIRECDAIVHVVRCFDDENIIHVDGAVNPARDMETIGLELIFADLETVKKRGEKAEKLVKTGDKKYAEEAELAKRLYAHLESGKPARTFALTESEAAVIRDYFLLTMKPVIYAANIAEDQLGLDESELPYVQAVKKAAAAEGAEVLVISAQIEEEVAQMPEDEKAEFLAELGIPESGLDRMVQACYRLLGQISFLTAGEDECRAWTIRVGDKAPKAAGVIHTDFERGFIRAEVIKYDDFVHYKTEAAVRAAGKMGIEGKDYVVQDGDIMHFLFNV